MKTPPLYCCWICDEGLRPHAEIACDASPELRHGLRATVREDALNGNQDDRNEREKAENRSHFTGVQIAPTRVR